MLSASERIELKKVWQVGKGDCADHRFIDHGNLRSGIGSHGICLQRQLYCRISPVKHPFGSNPGHPGPERAAYPPKLVSIGIIFAGLVLIMLA